MDKSWRSEKTEWDWLFLCERGREELKKKKKEKRKVQKKPSRRG
jgi:hypothetical protein